MQKVTMTRDMRPYRQNDTAVLPDDVAQRLVADGEATDPRPWPLQAEAPVASTKPPTAKHYKTKDKG